MLPRVRRQSRLQAGLCQKGFAIRIAIRWERAAVWGTCILQGLPSFCGMRFLLGPTHIRKIKWEGQSQSPASRMPVFAGQMVNGRCGRIFEKQQAGNWLVLR